MTGLSIRHLGEYFQCANDTISHYFRHILIALSSPPFYPRYVHLPPADSPVPPEIANNPKFFLYFCSALSVMDGTQIDCCPSALE
ncbi:hypothetical protein JAAARDRAFT_141650 [Jaapia argillacea MUCL 33604]|uniref:Transposase Helix-turn-helix domain-containing protein n=1 Tax=Jaapia argillacea MUCL 33604 TaxID=933084 RepID=A0A067PJI8_9AGAM|nr:hypothetical protein JAAARDRAFT_141650 [Jaapia argillacea MUCL 33604]